MATKHRPSKKSYKKFQYKPWSVERSSANIHSGDKFSDILSEELFLITIYISTVAILATVK